VKFDKLLLTNQIASKDYYQETIFKTAQAISKAFNSSFAYKGLTPSDLKKELYSVDILPQKGKSYDEVLEDLSKKILPNFLYTSSKKYMAHLHSPAIIDSIASELIISTFNQSMDSWDQSPIATEVELVTINTLSKLYGYTNNSDGVFTSGGSQSNFSGIMCARDWYCNEVLNHDIKKEGLPSNYSKFRFYTSSISHFSVEKSAHILGFGYNSVRKVDVDTAFKMDTIKLEEMIKDDINEGNIPVAIIATLGTTDFGSIDDVKKIREICDKYNLYLHSDAAYGGALIFSEKNKYKIEGIELSDSITIDFHKMFLLPISCSAFLVKDKNLLNPYQLHADYLNREEDEEEGYTNLVGKTIQTTRRFDALKVWVALQTQGVEGFSSIIDTCIGNANKLYNLLDIEEDFKVLIEPELSSVVFKYKGSNNLNKKIRKTLMHENGLVIGQTSVNNITYLKCTLLNPLIDIYDLGHIIKSINNIVKNNFKK